MPTSRAARRNARFCGRTHLARANGARSSEVFAMLSPYHGGRTAFAATSSLAQFCLGENQLICDIAKMDINIRSGIAEYPLENRVDMLEMVAEIEAFFDLFG